MVALRSLEAETMLAEQELDRISGRSLRNRADKAMLERAQNPRPSAPRKAGRSEEGEAVKRSPLKRGTPLRRTGWLKRRRSSRPVVTADVWREGLEHEVCVVCGAHGSRVRLDGHHAVPKRVLIDRGFGAFINDRRNRVPVCRFDHESHETRSRPIRSDELPLSVFRFAGELGLGWYVERHYPATVAA